jgi:hypothetical protein
MQTEWKKEPTRQEENKVGPFIAHQSTTGSAMMIEFKQESLQSFYVEKDYCDGC